MSTNSFQQFSKEVTMIYTCITFCGCSMSLSKVNMPVYSTVQYKMLGNTLMDIFYKKSTPKGCIWGSCEISFKGSINQFFERSGLTKVIAARLLTNFTFVLQRIFEQKFLTIFCYTEFLFPRHSESDRTLLSSRPTRKFRKMF